jgi:hypothetical protein
MTKHASSLGTQVPMRVIDDPAIRKLREMGKLREIADHLGIKRTAPWNWRRVPSRRVLDVARISGLQPHVLRPDLYPPEFKIKVPKKAGTKTSK